MPKSSVPPKLILKAAQAADLTELQRLARAGADFNVVHRGYRPLHALIQEKPHASAGTGAGEPAATSAPGRSSGVPAAATAAKLRLRALEWLLAHGADPELTGAWPRARAILVAAFCGDAEVVSRLRGAGANIDGFVECALGNAAAVRRILGKDPSFAKARDVGGLTALQCAAASRARRRRGLRAFIRRLDGSRAARRDRAAARGESGQGAVGRAAAPERHHPLGPGEAGALAARTRSRSEPRRRTRLDSGPSGRLTRERSDFRGCRI